MKELTQYHSLSHLSPNILQAYYNACTALDRTEVAAEEMMGYDGELAAIRQHDDFFQCHLAPDHTTSPLFVDILSMATIYIVDFEGWAHCPIMDFIVVRDCGAVSLLHRYGDDRWHGNYLEVEA